MRIRSKLLIIILGSVAAVWIIGGGTMFGIGGNQQVTRTSATGDTTAGIGWLNFDINKVGVNFDQFIELARNAIKNLPAIIKTIEDKIAANTNPADTEKLNAELSLKKAELDTSNNAIVMYGLAIAGVVIMSVGLGIGVITAAMATFRFVSKKNKVTVNR